VTCRLWGQCLLDFLALVLLLCGSDWRGWLFFVMHALDVRIRRVSCLVSCLEIVSAVPLESVCCWWRASFDKCIRSWIAYGCGENRIRRFAFLDKEFLELFLSNYQTSNVTPWFFQYLNFEKRKIWPFELSLRTWSWKTEWSDNFTII